MSSPITLPVVTIQHTLQTVIDDVRSGLVTSEDIWISCYKLGSTSVHGKAKVSLAKTDGLRVNFEAADGVEFNSLGGGSYTAACPVLNIPPTRLIFPRQSMSDPDRADPRHPQQITAIDVSPDGTQIATGYNDGTILLSPVTSLSQPSASTNSAKLSCQPHLTTVTSLRFFPSSRVLLSAGADFTLHILPAEAAAGQDANTERPAFKPVRTLKAHTRSITSTAMVSRGRNILSSAKDGTIRLWDVSGGQQIRAMWSTRYVPVNDMSIGEKVEFQASATADPDGESESTPKPITLDAREVDTAGNVVFCALQDGEFEAFDLATKNSVFHSSSNTSGKKFPLTAISYSSTSNFLATGSSKGIVTVYDTRNLSSPLTSFTRNGSSIESLAFVVPSSLKFSGSSTQDGELGLAIATEDGLPYIAEVRPEGPGVVAELVGGDCEAVRAVRVRSEDAGEVWTAGDDGIVRKY
ncbi:WD40 repeat-like protein [Neolentinus lepideus HHB14362 ss-1]|uniref:WD40 repeat-like protein n=1 Tax=Neolentinus lepideus HHB14362 ss-1 TaxID=1314782 RepID=A0A165T0D8_9AGAM|nr:WD40 repeat-like protein [Neolentinus lepideus HHB14362 ss-1]